LKNQEGPRLLSTILKFGTVVNLFPGGALL
jgi:hypothetical protein